MKYSTQVKSVSYFKSHLAEIILEVAQTREPMMLTQNGEAKLIVMDIRSYEEQQEMFALFKLLAMGNQEIEKGNFQNAADVFIELDGEES